jgi:hypothetical protein
MNKWQISDEFGKAKNKCLVETGVDYMVIGNLSSESHSELCGATSKANRMGVSHPILYYRCNE